MRQNKASDNFKNFVIKGDFENARKELRAVIGGMKLSEADIGEVHAELASLYLTATDAVLERFGAFQNSILKELRELGMRERIISGK